MVHKVLLIFVFAANPVISIFSIAQTEMKQYPAAEISNNLVRMKLYLPDPEAGYYRGTRFEWSGIISSLKYKGHQYFGEWKSTHDPYFHEDLTGPVEGAINPGLGYGEADAGEQFIRIGVGVLEKPDEKEYQWNHTYKAIDYGKWYIEKGRDWIEFRHELASENGYGYIYTKRIDLKKNEPGFTITHILQNTGSKHIETDQFNHNFFVIDRQTIGPGFSVGFPFKLRTDDDLKNLVKINNSEIVFTRNLTEGSIWLLLEGYGTDARDHKVTVKNAKTGAGIQFEVDRPLSRLAFWATTTTLCPENFIWISVAPGKEEKWISDYTLFTISK
jgi:hypothetical protein